MLKPPVPARKLRKSAVKNICRFATAKSETGQSILIESIMEKDFCYYLEFSHRVQKYSPQPETLQLVLSDGSSYEYTPDFKALFASSELTYIEVKPKDLASSDLYQMVFQAAERALAERGIRFQLITEEFIYRAPLLDNLKRLHRYRKESFFNKSDLYHVSKSVPQPTVLGDLIKCLDGRNSLQEIYSWLAFGYVKFDIETEMLSIHTEVFFHVE